MAKPTTIHVRAKVAHTEPGTQTYRELGEKFTHKGKLYGHVEPTGKAVDDDVDEEAEELEGAEGTAE